MKIKLSVLSLIVVMLLSGCVSVSGPGYYRMSDSELESEFKSKLESTYDKTEMCDGASLIFSYKHQLSEDLLIKAITVADKYRCEEITLRDSSGYQYIDNLKELIKTKYTYLHDDIARLYLTVINRQEEKLKSGIIPINNGGKTPELYDYAELAVKAGFYAENSNDREKMFELVYEVLKNLKYSYNYYDNIYDYYRGADYERYGKLLSRKFPSIKSIMWAERVLPSIYEYYSYKEISEVKSFLYDKLCSMVWRNTWSDGSLNEDERQELGLKYCTKSVIASKKSRNKGPLAYFKGVQLSKDDSLSPSIRKDMYLLKAREYISKKDYMNAYPYLAALYNLRVKHKTNIPNNIVFFMANSQFNLGGFNRAYTRGFINEYLKHAGSNGRYYQDALMLLDKI